MAKTLTATVTGSASYTYSNATDVATTNEAATVQKKSTYTSGKGADKLDIMYRGRVTVTTGSPNQDLNLRSLTDAFGATVAFEQVRTMLFINQSTTVSDDVLVGPQSVANGFVEPWNNAAAGVNVVQPEGSLLIDAPNDGFDVETTERVIRISYNGTSGSIDVDVVIMGSSGDLEESSSSSTSQSASSASSSSSYSSSSSSSNSSSSSVRSSSSSSSVAFSSSSHSFVYSSSSTSSSSVIVSSSSSSLSLSSVSSSSPPPG